MPSGVVRAFDARTGALRWSWNPIPQDARTGAANAWSVIVTDPGRHLVFVPTGSASPDYYGGERREGIRLYLRTRRLPRMIVMHWPMDLLAARMTLAL